MQRRLENLLRGFVLAFGSIAAAAVVTLLLLRRNVALTSSVAPVLFLVAVLACSWLRGYVAGLTSVVLAGLLAALVLPTEPVFAWHFDPYRFALLVLLSAATSWISSNRREVESELRAQAEKTNIELQSTVEKLEREVRERRAAEEEVRRLNHLLERRVDERTRQLEVSNQELESFSYSVSHDLRAPLRSIDGFSRILLSTCLVKLDAEEQALFQRILAATSRMNELIDDLLNLSRVARITMRSENVDLTRVVQQIVADLLHDHPETRTQFVIAPGLTAKCDRGLVEVALRNLLDNAWKFSSLSPDPCVEFGSTFISGESVFFVRDNGAGFDPTYKSKLFAPFQRLHRQEEFPGTGIGLATVLRIVHRHGGWITADSELGKGATFCFTLGIAPDSAPLTPGIGTRSLDVHLPEDPNPPLPRTEFPSSSSNQSTVM